MIDITNVIQCFCPGKRARGGPTAIHSTPSRPQHGDGLPKTLNFFFSFSPSDRQEGSETSSLTALTRLYMTVFMTELTSRVELHTDEIKNSFHFRITREHHTLRDTTTSLLSEPRFASWFPPSSSASSARIERCTASDVHTGFSSTVPLPLG